LQQASVDELVEVEGGELSRDPDLCGGLIPRHWLSGVADERVHAQAQIIGQRRDRPY
jgi:hypothetical protein